MSSTRMTDAPVFHRLEGEFERASAFHVHVERGIVAAGKPGVQPLDQARRAGVDELAGGGDAFHQPANAEAFPPPQSGARPSC